MANGRNGDFIPCRTLFFSKVVLFGKQNDTLYTYNCKDGRQVSFKLIPPFPICVFFYFWRVIFLSVPWYLSGEPFCLFVSFQLPFCTPLALCHFLVLKLCLFILAVSGYVEVYLYLSLPVFRVVTSCSSMKFLNFVSCFTLRIFFIFLPPRPKRDARRSHNKMKIGFLNA